MDKPLILLYLPQSDKSGNVNTMPYSLLALASVIDENKFEIKIVDGALIKDPIELIQNSNNLLAVGLSIITGPPIQDALRFARLVRKFKPKVPLIWGGFHASVDPEGTLLNPLVDFVIKGQGEIPFKKLIESLLEGNNLEGINGLVYKKNGVIINNPIDKPIDINLFPRIPFKFINIKDYIIPMRFFSNKRNMKGIVYVTSQGCPYNCTFCSDQVLYLNHWHGLTVDRMIEDIKMFIIEYGIDCIMFFDNNFFVNRKRVTSLCNLIIKENLNFLWYADIRIDQINRLTYDELKLIKKAGGDVFLVGAESGNADLLKLLNKKIYPIDILKAAEKCRIIGIKIIYSFMSGFPFIYREEFKDTLNIILQLREIDPQLMVYLCSYTPYPGTPLFEKYKSLVDIPKNLEEWARYSLTTCNLKFVNKKHKKILYDTINFYLPLALSTLERWEKIKNLGEKCYFVKGIHSLLQKIALYRLKNLNFKFKIEKLINSIMNLRVTLRIYLKS